MELIEKHSNAESSNSFDDLLTGDIKNTIPSIEVIEDPLDWWREHKNEFPIL